MNPSHQKLCQKIQLTLFVLAWSFMMVGVALLAGCKIAKESPPPPKLSAASLEEDRTKLFTSQLLRKGWTVTNWNGEEIWVSPTHDGKPRAFVPKTPPIPRSSFARMKTRVFMSSSDAAEAASVVVASPTVRVVNYTNEFQNVVVLDEHHKPILHQGWVQDTNIYSPNLIWVFDSSFGPPPGNAKYITTQQ